MEVKIREQRETPELSKHSEWTTAISTSALASTSELVGTSLVPSFPSTLADTSAVMLVFVSFYRA